MGKALKIRKPVQHGVVKVPVVMQMEALECVAASLTMILAYYGKWIPLEQVHADCGVSRDGSNARNILKAARSYGLTAKGYRYEPESLKESGRFPCIIHWNFNHFVVLTTIISSLIGIIRPAFSRIFIDRLLTGQNPEWLYPFVIALALLAAIELLVFFISIGVNHRMDGKMASYGNTSFMWKVLRLPMEFFSQRIAGDFQQRQGTNASVSDTLVNTFASGFLQHLHYCNALAFS